MTAGSETPVTTAARSRSSVLRALRQLNARPEILRPLVIGIAAFAIASLLFLWGSHDRPVLRIEAAFSPKACCEWQVWVGGLSGDLAILPLRAGTDSVYTIPVYQAEIHRLFITVGTQPGGTVRVRRIWITRGDRTVSRVEPAELKRAVVYQAESRPAARGLALSSTGAQPAIDATVSLDSDESLVRLLLGRAVSERLITMASLLLLGSVILAMLVPDRRQRWFVGIAVAATIAGVLTLPWLSDRIRFHDDVAQAVGYASYVGKWKSRERFIVDMAFVVSLVAAAVVALIVRRSAARGDVPAPDEGLAHGLRRRAAAALLVGLPVVVVAIASAPNLRLYIGPPPKFVPTWDGNNFVFWQYLVQKTHLEPVKDFYWLYGLQWIFDEPPPWGLLASYGWFLTFWLFLAIGTYLSLSRFFAGTSLVLRYVLLCGLWLTAFLTSDMPFATRYIGPLGVVLLFGGIDGLRDRALSWRRVLFAAALLELCVFELAQAGYALVPIVFLIVAEFAVLVRRARGVRGGWLLTTSLTVGAPLAAAALVYVLTGTASQTVSLYRALTFSSSAYAFPSDVDQWVTHPATLKGIIFWSVPLTLVLGLTGLVIRRGRSGLSYAVVTALGLMGFMIMQKQILRPHVAPQVWLPLIFGLAYWAVSDTVLSGPRRRAGVVAVAGVAASVVLVSGGYRAGWNALRNGPSSIEGSVHALVHDRGTFARQAREQFSPATFANFSADWPVVRALQAVPQVRSGKPVWILGDESAITMMLGRSWPYYFNDMYDASPIDFQHKVLRGLARHPPARVVWDFSAHAMVFDAVPMPVRVPLLYEWSVHNLVPEKTIGSFAILRQRSGSERVDLAWWRERIGPRLDLGHIPAVATLPHDDCRVGSTCSTYIVVRLQRGAPAVPQVLVRVSVDGLPFEVAFEPGPESTYVIPLNRVWFWAAASGHGRVDTSAANGEQITVVRRRSDPDVLY